MYKLVFLPKGDVYVHPFQNGGNIECPLEDRLDADDVIFIIDEWKDGEE